MKSRFPLSLCAYSAAVGLVLALTGCTPDTRDCATSSIMLRVKCASGLDVAGATASLTRLEDDKFAEWPLTINCSRVSNIQVSIPDYEPDQHFDVIVQGQDEEGMPVGAPARLTNLPLAARCTAVDLTIGESSEVDAAMPDPNQKTDAGSMNTGGGDGGGDAEDKRADGVECSSSDECRSGFCVDGMCCVAACDGQCEACNVEGKEGSCVPVQGEPRSARPACSGTPPCKGSCDGENSQACVYPKGPEHTCGAAPSCDGNTALAKAQCDGTGVCGQPERVSCEGFLCDATKGACSQCSTSMPCGTGQWCRNGKCEAKLGNGMACGAGENSCASGHCASGVCCNNACSGPCETCSAAGQCGNRCVGPQTCGGGGTQKVCGCNPSCGGKCGGADGCGGTCPNNCTAPQTCGGGGTTSVCGCTPNCTGKCGGSNGCGGTCPNNCTSPQTCGGAGTANVCGCPSVPGCSSEGKFCNAQNTGTITCGAPSGCLEKTTTANCPSPPTNGSVTCSGGSCGWDCNTGYKKCSSACIPSSWCCGDASCTADADGKCDSSNGKCSYTVTLSVISSISGSVSTDQYPVVITNNESIGIGKTVTDAKTRAFVSFDLSSIPVGRVVTAATLNISNVTYTYDQDPFATFGPLMLDSVQYGTSLQASALYQSSSGSSVFLSQAKATSFSASVRDLVADDVALRDARGNRSQHRIRFLHESPEGSYLEGLNINKLNVKLVVTTRAP